MAEIGIPLNHSFGDTVKPGSLVITDKWYAYNELPLLGYYHESHNHSKGDYTNTKY